MEEVTGMYNTFLEKLQSAGNPSKNYIILTKGEVDINKDVSETASAATTASQRIQDENSDVKFISETPGPKRPRRMSSHDTKTQAVGNNTEKEENPPLRRSERLKNRKMEFQAISEAEKEEIQIEEEEIEVEEEEIEIEEEEVEIEEEEVEIQEEEVGIEEEEVGIEEEEVEIEEEEVEIEEEEVEIEEEEVEEDLQPIRPSPVVEDPIELDFALNDELNYEVTVKVLWQSVNIETFKLRRFQKFSTIFEHYMEKENVPYENILLKLRGKTIDKNDTPESVGLEVCDFIDGGILSDSFAKMRAASMMEQKPLDEGRILIKVQDGTKVSHVFSIRKTEHLKAIMVKYAKQCEIPLNRMKFYYDGEILKSLDTPASKGIENNDIIDVLVREVKV